MRKGWEIKNLGEVVEVLDNLRKPITKKHRVEGIYPYYGATGILSYVHEYIFDERLILIGEDGAKWKSGDNTAFIAEGKYWVNNHAHAVRPVSQKVIDNWIVYYLNFSDLTSFISGMTVPKLNQEKMRSIPIPIPPLSEQQEIVSILDDAFESIERAKLNAEQNLKNAKELFESYLHNIFENKGEDWLTTTLGEVCSLYQGIAINAKTKHALVPKSNLPLLRIKDLKNNTVEQYIDPNNFPINALVKEEDIIYTRTGSLGLVFRGKRGVLHNNSFKVVPNKKLSNDFLFIWLQNPAFKNKIMGLAMKAAQPDITHAIFKIQEINVPPINTQEEIVKKLDLLSNETKRLESIYQQKQNDLEELKKSILQKAFNGELKTSKTSS